MKNNTYNPARRIINKAVEEARVDRSVTSNLETNGYTLDEFTTEPELDENGDVIGTLYTGFTELDSTETNARTGN